MKTGSRKRVARARTPSTRLRNARTRASAHVVDMGVAETTHDRATRKAARVSARGARYVIAGRRWSGSTARSSSLRGGGPVGSSTPSCAPETSRRPASYLDVLSALGRTRTPNLLIRGTLIDVRSRLLRAPQCS
jgi:hypothetical protein